jgi:hypothetical protein
VVTVVFPLTPHDRRPYMLLYKREAATALNIVRAVSFGGGHAGGDFFVTIAGSVSRPLLLLKCVGGILHMEVDLDYG